MNIAVLGTGSVGKALGCRLATAGHRVRFGSRDPQCPRVQEVVRQTREGSQVSDPLSIDVDASDWAGAVADSEAVIVAVPWSAAEQVVRSVAPWQGRVLVDCINPLRPDLKGLDLHGATSASHQLQEWAPEARVVKAFNTASAATMWDPIYDGAPATLFYCGDDEEAKRTTAALAADLGFAPVDAGPLANVPHLESLAMLYIHLAMHGWGSNCAFRMVKRKKA